MVAQTPKHGFTPVPNRYLEALARAKLSGAQYQVVMVVIRKTWGWHKEEDRISGSQLAEMTGLTERGIRKAIKDLKDKGILLVNKRSWISALSLEKDPLNWTVESRLKVNKCSPSCGHTCRTAGEQTGTHKRDENKLNAKKTNTNRQPVFVVFDAWSDAKIIKHRQLTNDMQTAILKTLKEFSIESIKEAITNYGIILNSKKYFWTYKFTLEEFLLSTGKNRIRFANIKRFSTENEPMNRFLERGNREQSTRIGQQRASAGKYSHLDEREAGIKQEASSCDKTGR